MRKDRRGMSLVEIIVVIAVIGILAGFSVPLLGNIRYANTKKTVEGICSALDRQRVAAMTKEGNTFLYIYRKEDGCYACSAADSYDDVPSAPGTFGDGGIKLCGNSTEIAFSLGGTARQVEGDDMIRIGYKRSGVLDAANTNAEQIIVSGNGTHTITLIAQTGKYVAD